MGDPGGPWEVPGGSLGGPLEILGVPGGSLGGPWKILGVPGGSLRGLQMLPGRLSAFQGPSKNIKKTLVFIVFSRTGRAGEPLEVSGKRLGVPGGYPGVPGRSWGVPGGSLGGPWGVLGRSWGSLGGLWGVPGESLGDSGGPWGILGRSWGSLGGPWGIPGRSPDAPWAAKTLKKRWFLLYFEELETVGPLEVPEGSLRGPSAIPGGFLGDPGGR